MESAAEKQLEQDGEEFEKKHPNVPEVDEPAVVYEKPPHGGVHTNDDPPPGPGGTVGN